MSVYPGSSSYTVSVTVVKFSAFLETWDINSGMLQSVPNSGRISFAEFYSPSCRSRIVVEGLLRRRIRGFPVDSRGSKSKSWNVPRRAECRELFFFLTLDNLTAARDAAGRLFDEFSAV